MIRLAAALDEVRELLFVEVEATLVTDVRTSPTTRTPDMEIELIEIRRL